MANVATPMRFLIHTKPDADNPSPCALGMIMPKNLLSLIKVQYIRSAYSFESQSSPWHTIATGPSRLLIWRQWLIRVINRLIFGPKTVVHPHGSSPGAFSVSGWKINLIAKSIMGVDKHIDEALAMYLKSRWLNHGITTSSSAHQHSNHTTG